MFDNRDEGVIALDLDALALNPIYAELIAPYGAIAGPDHVRDPKRTGESAIQHTQGTVLKGRRCDAPD